jgi:uncharacterized protein (DUF1697 family)
VVASPASQSVVAPTTYAALLRSVNLGNTRTLRMSELRALCTEAGYEAVRTYIQSGNVVLRARMSEPQLVADLEARIAAHAGFEVPVVARSCAQMRAVVETCPFDKTCDPTKLVVAFLAAAPARTALDELAPDAFGDERFALVGRDLYLEVPHGQARSPLMQALARLDTGTTATVRNWRTVTTLLDMAEAVEQS